MDLRLIRNGNSARNRLVRPTIYSEGWYIPRRTGEMRIPRLAEGRGRRPSNDPRAERSARARRANSLRTAPLAAQRMSSSASLTRRRSTNTAFVVPPRVAIPGVALLLTTAWFVVNVPHLSLLDLLPF